MMQGLSDRDRNTLRVGGIASVVILAITFLGLPLQDQWSAVTREIDDANDRIRKIQTNVSDASEATTLTQKLRESATLHLTSATLKQQTAQLLQQISKLPSVNKIAVQRFEPMPLRDDEKFFRSAVSFQFSGTLDDLYLFLRDVQAGTPALKVERLSLTSDPREPVRVAGNMVLSGYAVVLKSAAKG